MNNQSAIAALLQALAAQQSQPAGAVSRMPFTQQLQPQGQAFPLDVNPIGRPGLVDANALASMWRY